MSGQTTIGVQVGDGIVVAVGCSVFSLNEYGLVSLGKPEVGESGERQGYCGQKGGREVLHDGNGLNEFGFARRDDDPLGDFLRFLVRLRAESNLVKPLAREKDKHPPASGYPGFARTTQAIPALLELLGEWFVLEG